MPDINVQMEDQQPSISINKNGSDKREVTISRALKLKRRATELLNDTLHCTALTLKKTRLSCPVEGTPSNLDPSSSLHQRLSSFSALNWRAKPTEVSVRRFAVHGWRCVRTDVLHCEACGKYVDAALPSLLSVSGSVFRSAVSRLNSMAIEGHESTCRFRCVLVHDEPLPDGDEYCKKIGDRAKQLELLNLRDINVEQLVSLSEEVCGKLGISDKKIAALACCGWTKSENISDAVECGYCARTLGLWIYRGDKSALNPEREHRIWCHYVTLSSGCIPNWLSQLDHIVEQDSNQKTSPKFEMLAKSNLLGNAIAKRDQLNTNQNADDPHK